jgi:hypothetical protein
MNKLQKINQIREIIKAPRPPKIPKGIYKPTEAGIFKHESGFEITFSELKDIAKAAKIMVEAVAISGDEYPLVIRVSPFSVGWTEIRTIESSSVEDMKKHWLACGLTEAEINNKAKEYIKPEEMVELFCNFWDMD